MAKPKHESPREQLRELEHTAAVGESEKTPWILLGQTWVITSILVLGVLILSAIAYGLAT
ncbi:MAG: hypothetical protein ACJ757_04325 [Gaiellaceae bacterium]